MAKLIDLKTFTDARGNLTVIERVVPFDIKRIFYFYGEDTSMRGGHRHHKTIQAAICLKGKCRVISYDGVHSRQDFLLERPDQCLIIEPADWHQMDQFSPDAILMVLASEYFSLEDYIYEPYSK